MLVTLLALLVVLSWIYWLLALWASYSFFSVREEPGDFAPPVSVLKPVRGMDYELYRNLRSFCEQDYPNFEILVGMESPDDPAFPVIQRLKREFPGVPIRIVIAEPEGINRKAGILEVLSRQARHPVLVISDSDVRVRPDYLRHVVSPLKDSRIGVVTAFYRGVELQTVAARVEALYFNVSLLPSATIGLHWLDMGYAFGATIAVRREDLDGIGSFRAFADHLADDYEIGARIRAQGKKVHFSRYIVDLVLGPVKWRELWQRQLRWMRCSWVSRPMESPGLAFVFSIPLSLLVGLLTGFSLLSRVLILLSLVVRFTVGWLFLGCIGYTELRSSLLLVPLVDVLHFALWLAAPLGRRVSWRGREYILRRDGRLLPAPRRRIRLHIPIPWLWRR